jgi:uncharacterized membrane protein YphA (DoxX/SURF4 family)
MLAYGLLAGRLFLAAVFTVAGVGKLTDRGGAREAVRAFGGPARAAGSIATVLALAELAVATGLVVSVGAWWAALGALALLMLLSAVVTRSLRRGEAPECHCFGRLHAARIGRATLARNATLAAAATAVLVAGAPSDVGASATRWVTNLDEAAWMALAGAFACGTVLLAGGWLVTELLRRNGRLIERVDQLEGALADAGLELPPDLHHPAAAPRAGDPAPAFALPDLDARRVTLEDLLVPGRGLALVFASATCHPCRVVLRSVAERRVADGEPQVVVIGEGSAEEWRALPAQLRPARVLLQRDREVADRYGADVTPAALAMSADGVLTGPPALGASAVRELLALAAVDRQAPAMAPRLAAQGASS